MSFYGIVLVVTVLIVSIYLSLFVNEINAVSWMSGAYAGISQTIIHSMGALVQDK